MGRWKLCAFPAHTSQTGVTSNTTPTVARPTVQRSFHLHLEPSFCLLSCSICSPHTSTGSIRYTPVRMPRRQTAIAKNSLAVAQRGIHFGYRHASRSLQTSCSSELLLLLLLLMLLLLLL